MDIEKLISGMSLREKISQTVVTLMNKNEKPDADAGAAFFFGQIITEADEAGLDELRGYARDLIERSKIPPFITSDFENGCGSMVKGLTALPYIMGLGAADSEQMAYDYGKATALEARSVGANWSFSPVSDLNLNPRNPLVNVRCMTDDTSLAVRLLPQVIKGMQDAGLAACAKHFPGDGVDYRDQHIVTTVNSLPMEEWNETFRKVYRAVIAEGVSSIMMGHISLPAYKSDETDSELPASLRKSLITDLLKGELGYEGIVVTDALDMGGFVGFYDSREQSEIESLKAGCDMLLWPSDGYVDRVEKAVSDGYIPESRIDDAVRRILTVKDKMGLFNDDYSHIKLLTAQEEAFVKSTQKKISDMSITLIRDEAKFFPFNKDKIKKIGILPVVEHQPSKPIAYTIKKHFEARGFDVELYEGDVLGGDALHRFYQRNDVVIYELFSRPFRPIGFLDYTAARAAQVSNAFKMPNAREKNIVVSFGSPYFGNQYFGKAKTYVNCYSMLENSVEAFVRAACGEVEFVGKSPVKL